MKKIVIVSYIFIGVLMSSCGVKSIALDKSYFNKKSKVALIMNLDSIGVSKAGGQGLLDMALTQGKRFRKPLKSVDSVIHPQEEIQKLYIDILKNKGKEIVMVDKSELQQELPKFKKPKDKKEYFKYDLRFLKDAYNVDEVFVVSHKYGLLVSYYGMIETGKNGHSLIITELIDVTTNEYLLKETTTNVQKIQGKWKANPPEYPNLRNAIKAAVDATIAMEKEKYK